MSVVTIHKGDPKGKVLARERREYEDGRIEWTIHHEPTIRQMMEGLALSSRLMKLMGFSHEPKTCFWAKGDVEIMVELDNLIKKS